jgi:hypothetical protein
VAWVRRDALDGDSVRSAVDAASSGGRLHIGVVVPGGGSISPVIDLPDVRTAVDAPPEPGGGGGTVAQRSAMPDSRL